MIRIASYVFLHTYLLLLFCSVPDVDCKKLSPPTKEQLKSEKLPPCAACRILTESFKKVSLALCSSRICKKTFIVSASLKSVLNFQGLGKTKLIPLQLAHQ